MKMALYLCDLPLNSLLQTKYEKSIIKIPTKGHLTNYLTIIPQKQQGHQKRGKSGNPSQAREA